MSSTSRRFTNIPRVFIISTCTHKCCYVPLISWLGSARLLWHFVHFNVSTNQPHFSERGEVWGVRCAVRLCTYTLILLLLLPLSHLRCHIVIIRITVVMSRSAIIAVFSAQRVKIAIDKVTMFVLYVSFFICLFLYSSSPLESHQIE